MKIFQLPIFEIISVKRFTQFSIFSVNQQVVENSKENNFVPYYFNMASILIM